MPLGNLEKIIEEQADKLKRKTRFIPGKKILLFFLILIIIIVGGLSYYFRNYIDPINNVIKQTAITHRNLKQINNYIEQADFKNATILMNHTINNLDSSLTTLAKIEPTGYKSIDQSIKHFQENVELANNYITNLKTYINIANKYTIRIQVYGQFSLINRPIALIPQDTRDSLAETQSRLELNTYALDESCSQKNYYINKINLCPKLKELSKSLDELIKKSNLPNDLQIGKQNNLTQS